MNWQPFTPETILTINEEILLCNKYKGGLASDYHKGRCVSSKERMLYVDDYNIVGYSEFTHYMIIVGP